MLTCLAYFIKACPVKSCILRVQKFSCGKHNKVCLTGLAFGNAFRERLSIFAFGKLQKPMCFEGVKHLPCQCRSQLKSWMSSELFQEWVCKLCQKFGSDKQKIALIINKCKAQLHVEHLEWVELIFLLPNTTSVTQPMDQGIIRLLKAKYCSLVVRRLISSLEKKASVPAIISAMMWLSKA